MAFADGSQRRTALIAEVTPGTTPSTPTFQTLRTISCEPNIGRPKLRTNERRADRRTSQVYKGLAGSSCTMEFEWADDAGIDLILASALNSSFSGDIIKDGVTAAPFTIEVTDETGGTDSYYRVRGQQVNTMSINIAPGQAITSQVSWLGMDGAQDTAIISGATYTAAGTEKIFCGTDIQSVTCFGLSGMQIASVNININNNLRQRHSINASIAPYPFGIGLGAFEVTGQVVLFRQNTTDVALDLSDTVNQTLVFTAGIDSSKHYTFSLLEVAITGHRVSDGGNNGDIMTTLNFQALYDSGDSSQFKITRNT